MDDSRLREATGRPMEEWIAELDGHDGRALAHKDIARLLRDDFGVSGWWSQMLTVEYERAIGRREVGQRQSGEFRTTVSRTVRASTEDTLALWIERLPGPGAGSSFDGVVFANDPRLGGTPRRRTWRVDLEDGARVTVFISPNGPASTLAVEVSKLTGQDDIARWKAFWKGYLAAF